MIQDIDFLPASYRKQQEGRRRTVWRRAALAAFLMLFVTGIAGQRQVRRQLEVRRATLQRTAERMTLQLGNPQLLQDEITRLDRRANLLTLLQLQPRASRVLSTVTGALPQYVSLTDLSLRSELIALSSTRPGRTAPAGKKDTPAKPPEELDCERLQKEMQERGLVVSISGIAPHDLAIAAYLSQLKKSELFSDIALQYTDQHLIDDQQFRRFAARLTVRPIPLQPPAASPKGAAAAPALARAQPTMPRGTP